MEAPFDVQQIIQIVFQEYNDPEMPQITHSTNFQEQSTCKFQNYHNQPTNLKYLSYVEQPNMLKQQQQQALQSTQSIKYFSNSPNYSMENQYSGINFDENGVDEDIFLTQSPIAQQSQADEPSQYLKDIGFQNQQQLEQDQSQNQALYFQLNQEKENVEEHKEIEENKQDESENLNSNQPQHQSRSQTLQKKKRNQVQYIFKRCKNRVLIDAFSLWIICIYLQNKQNQLPLDYIQVLKIFGENIGYDLFQRLLRFQNKQFEDCKKSERKKPNKKYIDFICKDVIGISHKTIQDYQTQFKKGFYFRYNFQEALKQNLSMGNLRKFIRQKEAEYFEGVNINEENQYKKRERKYQNQIKKYFQEDDNNMESIIINMIYNILND